MKSIAIINGSRKRDGITQGSLAIYRVLKESGFLVNWYQVIDSGNMSEYPSQGTLIRGIALPSYYISNGLNRLFFLKRPFNSLKEDLIFLSDPTLVEPFVDLDRLVVKFHDFRPISKYSDKLGTRMLYNHVIPKLRKVESGIFISGLVQEEAAKLGIEPKKVFQLPEPSFEGFSPKSNLEKSLQNVRNGFLTFTYIATDRPYKNINFFLELSAEFSKRNNSKFILVSNLKSSRRKYILKNYPNVKIVEGASDIKVIYEDTDILLHPSLYDGFGRPIIEAMSFGIPVIASKLEPFVEISSGSSTLCEPNMVSDWTGQMDKFFNEDHYREMSEKSTARSLYFAWDSFEERVLSIFGELV